AIARIERALATPARVAGLALAPDAPIAGTPSLITATVADDVSIDASDRPRFVVRRGGQRVGRRADAEPGTEPGTWIATYSFPSSGRYHIAFITHDSGDDDRYELTTEVTVSRAPRSQTSGPVDPPPVTTQGAAGPFGPPVPRIVDAPLLPPRTPQLASTQSPQLPPPHTTTSPPPPIHPLAPSAPVNEEPPSPPSPPPPPTPWSSGG
nr:hypothetical protein [Myxococcota bacterium]